MHRLTSKTYDVLKGVPEWTQDSKIPAITAISHYESYHELEAPSATNNWKGCATSFVHDSINSRIKI